MGVETHLCVSSLNGTARKDSSTKQTPRPRRRKDASLHPLNGPKQQLNQLLRLLKAAGYTEDFNPHGPYLTRQRAVIQLAPDEFEVDEHYRFEGPTDPADEALRYAISSAKFNLKGTLVNGYGIYSDPISDQLLSAPHQKTLG